MRFLALFSLAALAGAQPGAVGGPVSGYVFDAQSRVLRPVVGIPGAATIGDPVNFGFDLRTAWVAPRPDSAVAIAADGGLHFFRLDSGAAAERSVTGISISPTTVVFSPSGTAAALISGTIAQIVTGLPDSPAAAATLELANGAGQPHPIGGNGPAQRRVSYALSDDGAYLLDSAAAAVQVYGADGNNWKLMDADGAMLAFAPGSHDAAVADSRGSGLLVFTGLADQTVLASSILPAVGLAFSADGHTLYLADAGSVTTFDRAGDAGSAVACSCHVSTLAPMSNALRLNEMSAGPLWLFDPGTSRTVFVPALVAAQ